MWDLSRPGIESVSPALAGWFFTTGPPGKSSRHSLNPASIGLQCPRGCFWAISAAGVSGITINFNSNKSTHTEVNTFQTSACCAWGAHSSSKSKIIVDYPLLLTTCSIPPSQQLFQLFYFRDIIMVVLTISTWQRALGVNILLRCNVHSEELTNCKGIYISWRRAWQPTPVFLLGESHGQRSLVGYGPRGCKESDTTAGLST